MNVMRLAAADKPVVIYLQPRDSFGEIRTHGDLATLLNSVGAGAVARLRADAAAEGLTGQLGQIGLRFSA